MTANVDSRVKDSCNNWACCLWCCGKKDDVIEVRPAPVPIPQPAQLVRTVALQTLKDVGSLSGETQIQFDAVHLTVHHTPQVTPETSEHD